MTQELNVYLKDIYVNNPEAVVKCPFTTKEDCYKLISLALACGYRPITTHEVGDEHLSRQKLNKNALFSEGFITIILNSFICLSRKDDSLDNTKYRIITPEEFKVYCAKKGRH